MTVAPFVVSPRRFIFDGQSLNGVFLGNFPGKLMAYAPQVPYNNLASGGQWEAVLAVFNQRSRPAILKAETPIVVMNGGTYSILVENDTGQELYDIEALLAGMYRDAGADYVVTLTLVSSTSFNGTEETNRQSANVLKLADTSPWDAVVDIAADARLADPTDLTYYSDGTHWTDAGAQVAADLVYPALVSLGVMT